MPQRPKRSLNAGDQMKMRAYVDGIQGPGSWDRMHELINRNQALGWVMPPIMVDGVVVQIFPGLDREVTLEEVRTLVRKRLREANAFRQMTIMPRPPANDEKTPRT
jgi:hypothetical protein